MFGWIFGYLAQRTFTVPGHTVFRSVIQTMEVTRSSQAPIHMERLSKDTIQIGHSVSLFASSIARFYYRLIN